MLNRQRQGTTSATVLRCCGLRNTEQYLSSSTHTRTPVTPLIFQLPSRDCTKNMRFRRDCHNCVLDVWTSALFQRTLSMLLTLAPHSRRGPASPPPPQRSLASWVRRVGWGGTLRHTYLHIDSGGNGQSKREPPRNRTTAL